MARQLLATRVPMAARSALRATFWLGAVLFIVGVSRLAKVNVSDGGWDSASNLIAARNVAEGRGLTTNQVQDFVALHPVEGPETVRAPGLPYVMGMIFRAVGVSTSAVVWLNGLLILVAAFALRTAVRLLTDAILGDATGLLLLVSAANYELVALVNNNALVAATCIAILLAAMAHRGRLHGVPLALACGALGAAAFLVKQSYVLSFAPFATLLLGLDPRYRLPQRFAHVAIAGVSMIALTAGYWLPNLLDHGTPLYSPIQKLRIPLRYGLIPLDGYQRAVYVGQDVPGYADVARQIGVGAMLRRELDIVRMLPAAVFGRGALVICWAAATLLFARRRHWRVLGSLATLAVAPFFDALWWLPEPRYFFPLFAVLLCIAAVGTSDYRVVERAHIHPRSRWRFRTAAAIALGLIAVGAILKARWGWRAEFAQARTPPPEWVSSIERLPAGALIMTTFPPQVGWWTRRATIIEPLPPRADLQKILGAYRPQYYLDMAPGPRPHRPPFLDSELAVLERGEEWILYRLIEEAPAPAAGASP